MPEGGRVGEKLEVHYRALNARIRRGLFGHLDSDGPKIRDRDCRGVKICEPGDHTGSQPALHKKSVPHIKSGGRTKSRAPA